MSRCVDFFLFLIYIDDLKIYSKSVFSITPLECINGSNILDNFIKK